MISIIVPIYNAESTLPECIESILSQEFGLYEIVLVNDGSTDNSQRICEVYKKKNSNIKLINIENKGAYAARTIGVKNASGRFITFLDSDDSFKKNSLKAIIEELETDIDILVTSCKENQLISQRQYQKDLMSNRVNAALHGRFFKNNIICDSMLDISRNFVIGEDLILNLRASLYAHRIKYSRAIIYNYNCNEGSITQNFKRSWDYEKDFHILINDVFMSQISTKNDEIETFYHLLFLRGCKLALLNKSKINYTDIEWKKMKNTLNQHREMLWWDEKLTLDIQWGWFCRNLIRVLYRFI